MKYLFLSFLLLTSCVPDKKQLIAEAKVELKEEMERKELCDSVAKKYDLKVISYKHSEDEYCFFVAPEYPKFKVYITLQGIYAHRKLNARIGK